MVANVLNPPGVLYKTTVRLWFYITPRVGLIGTTPIAWLPARTLPTTMRRSVCCFFLVTNPFWQLCVQRYEMDECLLEPGDQFPLIMNYYIMPSHYNTFNQLL